MKIDKIIYPIDNGTHVWWKINRYDVVIGNSTTYFHNWDVIRMLELELKQSEPPK